jgi:uncharacterized membrane protein YjgN (DUF898 family)
METTIENEITAPPAQEKAVESHVIAPSFTGSGKEYFRIWIVNLLLTVATLGIYSAWAKVRRLQYFYRNTQLAGATFDFHGDPKAILKGRLIAVALLGAYQYAFGFSLWAGTAILAALLVALPFLMRAALRFRLSNTSYRGLAFGFRGSLGGAYLAYLPPMVTVLLPGVLGGLLHNVALTAAALLLYLGWPLMHGAMKGYQHRNLQYGDQRAHYTASAWRFYRFYFTAGAMLLTALLFAVVLAGGLAVIVIAGGAAMGKNWDDSAYTGPAILSAAMFAVSGFMLYLAAGPYMQARTNNLVWSDTYSSAIRVQSRMGARSLLRLQAANVALTLLTLGLYRPFAAVKVYQYRLAHLSFEIEGDIEDVLAAAQPRQRGATGDGAADFIGVDISW